MTTMTTTELPIDEAQPWSPGTSVVNHNGDGLAPERDFFAQPPKEIGEVLTASTTLLKSKRPTNVISRIALSGFLGSAGLALLYLLGVEETILQVLAFLVLAPLGWWLTGFKHTVRYVGKEGIARLTCKNRRDRIVKAEVFPFAEAAELRTGQTRQYYNGIYSGTSYYFNWTGPDGRKRFKLSGSYYGEKKPPKPKDPFHFAGAAERAWSLHLLDRATEELEKTGAIRFRLDGANWIAVGPGFLEFVLKKGEPQRWEKAQIGAISLGDGVFKLKHVDAQEGWFSKSGVYSFSYATMSNARLFFIALEKLLGYQFN
jgi:hypothetical protein